MVEPLAVSVVVCPEQIAADEALIEIVGVGVTVIVAVPEEFARQPNADVPVTVYTIVIVGEAIGEALLGLFKPVAGDHVYVFAPLTLKPIELPEQIVPEPEVMVKVGVGLKDKLVFMDVSQVDVVFIVSMYAPANVWYAPCKKTLSP